MWEEAEFVPDIHYLVFRKCNAGWRIQPHLVSNYDITYIIKGNARYTISGKKNEISSGDLICIPENTPKAAITYPDRLMHCFSVNFRLKNLDKRNLLPPFNPVQHIGLEPGLIQLFDDLVYTWQDHQPGYLLKSRGLLFLILHRLFELTESGINSFAGDYRIKQAMRYIARHYRERIIIKNLADTAKLNTSYFGILFKQTTGLTIHQYAAKIRVQNAKNMLQSGMYKVSEAAEYCGYGDIFYFYKQFKALTGKAPVQYIPSSKNSADPARGGGGDIIINHRFVVVNSLGLWDFVCLVELWKPASGGGDDFTVIRYLFGQERLLQVPGL
jgi:AraC-like DNA-binding protein